MVAFVGRRVAKVRFAGLGSVAVVKLIKRGAVVFAGRGAIGVAGRGSTAVVFSRNDGAVALGDDSVEVLLM